MVTLLGTHPLTGEVVRLTRTAGPVERKAAAGVTASAGGQADGATSRRELVVRFAKLNAIDADNDVTLPGAFPNREVLFSQWGHGSWQPGLLPAGRGRIREEDGYAVFRGECFATTVGQATFDAIKAAGPLCLFSYGYVVLDSELGVFEGKRVQFLKKLDVFEVSPVLRAAGLATGVVSTSGLNPLSIQVASAAHANELALAGVGKQWSHVIGYGPDGKLVRVIGNRRGMKVGV